MFTVTDRTQYKYKLDGEWKIHRPDNLPAVIHSSGKKEWFRNGQLHNDNGPAVIEADGSKKWFLGGKKKTESEWNAQRPIDPGTPPRIPTRGTPVTPNSIPSSNKPQTFKTIKALRAALGSDVPRSNIIGSPGKYSISE